MKIEHNMQIAEKILKEKLIERGFSEKNIINNRGIIGATVDIVLESLKKDLEKSLREPKFDMKEYL